MVIADNPTNNADDESGKNINEILNLPLLSD